MINNYIEALRRGGDVTRFHQFRTLRPQTVGHHSHGVAMLTWAILGGCSGYVLMAALAHDMAEFVIGDVPAPTKRRLGMRDALNDAEREVLKRSGMDFDKLSKDESWAISLADALDGVMYCDSERIGGNVALVDVRREYIGYIHALMGDAPPSGLLLERARQVVDAVINGG